MKIIPCLILLFSFLLIRCQATESLDKKTPDGCNATLTKKAGGFHLNVIDLSHFECHWYFQVEPGQNVSGYLSLFLHTLFLHENDEINLYRSINDSADDTNRLIDPIRVNNGSVTIITEEKFLVLKLTGNDTIFKRSVQGFYDGETPAEFTIPPYVVMLHSPIHPINMSAAAIECIYTWNRDTNFPHIIPTFSFEQFNFSASSTVEFGDSSVEGTYNSDVQMDYFPKVGSKTTTIKVQKNVASINETYRLRRHNVDERCSRYMLISGSDDSFKSPEEILNNGSFVTECRWIFDLGSKNILGVEITELHFDSALDAIAINDGASVFSPPLLQITTSNRNSTLSQFIRSQGRYMWMAFKPISYGSKVAGTVTKHSEGGLFRNNGTIKAGSSDDDAVFQLEVDTDQIVYLNFTETSLQPPATLSIYDGFDKSNLLATLNGNVWYPILSETSKMMIITKDFKTSSFKAEFKGGQKSCLHMSTISNENYILSGNCNASCLWIVPPQERPGSELLLNLQYLSLLEGDSIEIIQLDSKKTRIGTFYENVTHIPNLVIPADVGAVVEINRAPCPKEKEGIVLVGHSSYVPVCGKNLSVDALTEFQITSPLYPDTYPLFASCLWNISSPKDNIVHLVFDTLKLAPNHCIKVHSSNNMTQQYAGNELPEDLFLSGESTIEFDSSNCGKSPITNVFQSSGGFMLNGTVANCGGVLSKSTSGEFTVPPNKTLCIWKVSVPETDSVASDIVNIISYSVTKKDDKENYELHVYDGSSIRESTIKNISNSDIWSRTSNLIFIYKRINATMPSTILSVKYSTISCNETTQCDNKICLHPDWRCNGNNDCGDFSDERNCASVPITPEIKILGYTSLAFWLTVFLMLAAGIALGIAGPYCYERYKNGQYRRFGDLSVVQ